MDSGLYTSALGMLDEFNVEDSISSNLANQQTPGYKERSAVQGTFANLLYDSQDSATPAAANGAPIGRFGQAPQVDKYGLNLAQGTPRYTGSPLDFMVVGNGFFRVRAGNQTLLTRNGSFHRSAQGTLETPEGYAVLGANGRPLRVPRGTINVDEGGTIAVDGKNVGRLALARMPAGQSTAEAGGGYFRGPGQTVAAKAGGVGVLHGYLESSNVDLATQMSAMLSAQRSYQSDSQMMQIEDSTMGLTVNDLGKVSS